MVTASGKVPVGPLAFFPGKLVKTNELLVLLGENWFVERSAAQAVDLPAWHEVQGLGILYLSVISGVMKRKV